MKAFAVLALVLLASSALAQPSFDCAKASTVVERTVCKSADLAKADREMAALYFALTGKLAGAAKDHLLKDQVRWNGNRAAACTAELERCLQDKYASRIERLKFLGAGTYPFISDQAIVRTGKVKLTTYAIDASYPQFDGPGVDFSAVNTEFANGARKGAAASVPDRDIGDLEQSWGFDLRFVLHRPAPNLVAVEFINYSFTGGAHGNGGTFASLVDLRTGRSVPPASVFASGDDWRRTVAALVLADLKKQFVEKPGFDEAIEPANLAKLPRDPTRWLFKSDGLTIVFNAYDVGPYAAGSYDVEIPYARLRSVLRPEAPLGAR